MEVAYVDIDGVENVAVGVIKQARKDFIKGAKLVYSVLKVIPREQELMNNHGSLYKNQDARCMYDAWRFVIRDPYQFFGDLGEDAIINEWKKEAIIKYYEPSYIKATSKLYLEGCKKDVQNLSDGEVIEKLRDNHQAAEFIVSRNYISKLSNANEIFKEWNALAYVRYRKEAGIKGTKGAIGRSEFISEKKRKRQDNICKAKALRAKGLTFEEIAKELGVAKLTVHNYIHS